MCFVNWTGLEIAGFNSITAVITNLILLETAAPLHTIDVILQWPWPANQSQRSTTARTPPTTYLTAHLMSPAGEVYSQLFHSQKTDPIEATG